MGSVRPVSASTKPVASETSASTSRCATVIYDVEGERTEAIPAAVAGRPQWEAVHHRTTILGPSTATVSCIALFIL